MVYGYCRISTATQSIDRQVRNINEYCHNNVIIIKEVFTGTEWAERKQFCNLLSMVKEGDTIVFDSVSRMSRDADAGMRIYEDLYNRGVNLIFLKEHYIDTDTYRKAVQGTVNMTGTTVDVILKGVNEYLMILAKEQIKIALDQAEKEVQDLRQRTREGIETARLNGKQIGAVQGKKLDVKKAIVAKEQIKKYSKDFYGTLSDVDAMKIIGIARNTYYKYKRELTLENPVKS